MNFLKKKKEKKAKAEPIYKCGGKIVLTGFDGLDPKDFPYADGLTEENIGEQPTLLSFDGKMYVNQDLDTAEGLAVLYEILARNPQPVLDKWRRDSKKKFANVTFDNLGGAIQDENERARALIYLLIPSEIARRKVEKAYYSSRK